MADDFNPYREWLGLKSTAAPNYYELLSLPQFAAEPIDIGPAAARATTRVRSFRPGSRAAAWSRLLDEIQAARQCLTDRELRSAYDERLRRGNETPANDSAATAPPPPSALAAMEADFFPPGMAPARPQSPPDRPAPEVAATANERASAAATPPGQRSDLDPPEPQTESAEPALSQTSIAEPQFVEIESAPPAAVPDFPDFAEAPSEEYEEQEYEEGHREAAPAAAQDATETIDFEASLPLSAMPDAAPYGGIPSGDEGAAYSAYGGESAEAVSPGGVPGVIERRSPRRRSSLALVASACLGLLAAVAGGMVLGPQLRGHRAATTAEGQSESNSLPGTTSETQPTIAIAPPGTTISEPTPFPAPLPPPLPVPATVPLPASVPAPANSTAPVASLPAPNKTPVPAPSPPPSPSPPSAPSAPPPPEPPKMTRMDLQALVKAMESAREYYGEQNFKAANLQMEKAESLAKLPAHRQAALRLKEAGGYIRQFREAVAAALGGMQAGESFQVGSSTQVSFVEAPPNKVIFRIAGMNRTYALEDLPPGLAVVVADFKLPLDNPQSKIVKGAYLALHPRDDSETRDKARSLWEEARSAGAKVDHLLPLLDDDYAKWLKDAP